MKVYVIKNEEGKYLTETLDWNDCIFFAALYDEPFDILYDLETWQEITIAEGDLEKDIAVLKKALELMAESWSVMDNPNEPKEIINRFIQKAKEIC